MLFYANIFFNYVHVELNQARIYIYIISSVLLLTTLLLNIYVSS